MNIKEINNEFSIVFYVKNNPHLFTSENLFYKTLQNILTDGKVIERAKFKENQIYGFIAKILNDTFLNNDNEFAEIKRKVNEKISSFRVNKNRNTFEELLEILFYSWLIKMKGKDNYFNIFSIEDVHSILNSVVENNSLLDAKRITLRTLILNENNEKLNPNNDIYLLTLKYLIDSQNLNLNSDEKTLIEFYLLQKNIEESSKGLIESRNPIIFEITYLLDIITSEGLFLNRIEKLSYLSNSGRELLTNRFLSIVNSSFNPKLKWITIPLWCFPIIIIGVQILFYFALETNVIEGFEPFGISLKKEILAEIIKSLPVYVILIFNCIVFVALIFLLKKSITNKVKND